MSDRGSSKGGRRWGRRSSRRDQQQHRQQQAAEDSSSSNYVPPTLDTVSPTSDTDTSTGGQYFVTSPPKQRTGLTGSISTLFRRSGSREGKREHRRKGGGGPNHGEIDLLDSSTDGGNSNVHSQASLGGVPVGTSSPNAVASPTEDAQKGSRLYYSSNQDDDSEDSFESRAISRVSQSHTDSQIDFGGSDDNQTVKTILRYRGFSTSIQSLFLDEPLVCASMGCFGLILSNRTEYLLQLRNDRRGVKWGRSSARRTLPSRIVAYALLLTLFLIAGTFVIWGFGSENPAKFADSFYDGVDYMDDTQFQDRDDDAAYGNNANDDNAAAYADQYDNGDDAINAQDDDGDIANGNDDQNANQGGNDDNDDAVANQDAINDDDDNGPGNDDDDNNNNNNFDQADAVDQNNDDNVNDAADGVQEDDFYAYGDDYNDDGGVRRMQEQYMAAGVTRSHRLSGIFKLRDYNEAIWEPAIGYIREEWQQPDKGSRHLASDDDDIDIEKGRDLASDLRVAMIFAFLVVLGILGRRRRMRTRYYLVRARAQEDHLYYASSGLGVKRVAFQDMREDQYEGACSHTLCGCYPSDPPTEGDELDDHVEVSDEGVTKRKKQHHHADCVARIFSCLMGMCCGYICKCWFQCLSVCALAQEAREIRLLLPPRYQRIDFITHQPFHEYQKDVNDLRRGWLGKTRKKSGFMPHLNALSRLSRYILISFLVTISVILLTLLCNPRASFSWPDAIVLIATFVQSFIVLYIVHWIFHKSDLSLDAVIKFFAAGFLIAVPSAFFFEGVLVNLTLSTAWLGYTIGEMIKGDSFVDWVIAHYEILWIIGELVNAYIVAAVTEELCKYYTFRCVEHPDLIFLTGLDRQAQDETSNEGGLVKYPFGSHQVQRSNKRNDDDSASVASRGSRASRASRGSRGSHRSRGSSHRGGDSKASFAIGRTTTEEEFYEDDHDVRTHRQRAAAVTTGMISVAVGLACAENFIYVFLLGGSGEQSRDVSGGGGLLEEWIVLLFRSIFPVHALAAAMQSINMIRKFVECSEDNNHRIGVGRIILPAVIMHGSFDAVLLGINVYIEAAWTDFYDQNGNNGNGEPFNPIVVNCVAWFSITLVMIIGMLWYYRENRNQRLRLILLEEQEKATDEGSQVPYSSPSELSPPGTSEVELV